MGGGSSKNSQVLDDRNQHMINDSDRPIAVQEIGVPALDFFERAARISIVSESSRASRPNDKTDFMNTTSKGVTVESNNNPNRSVARSSIVSENRQTSRPNDKTDFMNTTSKGVTVESNNNPNRSVARSSIVSENRQTSRPNDKTDFMNTTSKGVTVESNNYPNRSVARSSIVSENRQTSRPNDKTDFINTTSKGVTVESNNNPNRYVARSSIVSEIRQTSRPNDKTDFMNTTSKGVTVESNNNPNRYVARSSIVSENRQTSRPNNKTDFMNTTSKGVTVQSNNNPNRSSAKSSKVSENCKAFRPNNKTDIKTKNALKLISATINANRQQEEVTTKQFLERSRIKNRSPNRLVLPPHLKIPDIRVLPTFCSRSSIISENTQESRSNNKQEFKIPTSEVFMPSGITFTITLPSKPKCFCKEFSATKLINIWPNSRISPGEHQMISNEMNSTIKHHTTGVVSSYDIIKIQKVKNCCMWTKYRNRKWDIMKETGENNINERMLFHGSKAADDIVQRGFDERHSDAGGMFGAGVYFAKHSSKSNQYVFGGSRKCADHLSSNCTVCERKMILCRVVLGNALVTHTPNKIPHPPPGYHSVKGSPSLLYLKYPEYVIYRGEQAYPEYLITYKCRN